MANKDRQSGFYVAHHPLLGEAMFKVGYSSDLSRRLQDSSYTTCWPDPAWRFVATFETMSGEEAHNIETGVLQACRNFRVGSKELVTLPASIIIDAATKVAALLGIAANLRHDPIYVPAVRVKSEPSDKEEKEKTERIAKRVAQLIITEKDRYATVDTQIPLPTETASIAAVDEMNDYLDELLAEEIIPVTMPKLAPANTIRCTPAAMEIMRTPDLPATDDEPIDTMDIDTEYEFVDERGRPLDFRSTRVEMREYQQDAADACLFELERAQKAVLQMACRCGKTKVAHSIIEGYISQGGRALYLVPGLPLLRQTAQKLASYGGEVQVEDLILVGSDPVSVPVTNDREIMMTTNREAVGAFLDSHPRAVVISTYQSSWLLPDTPFAITVFDEAHRTAGPKKARPFNNIILRKPQGHRLFMTATPAFGKAELTMDDRTMFGGVAYRYHLHTGIKSGYINDFRLELVAASVDKGVSPTGTITETLLVQQIVSASATVDKMLVFCRDIKHSVRLCEAVSLALAVDRPTTRCLVAHSRMGKGEVGRSLKEFSTPGAKALLFSVRLLQEGVEIPMLNAVFFAAPRHSTVDIIQSICRPLNHMEGKPQSVIFLPVTVEKGKSVNDPANLDRFATIVPFVDALMQEDTRLYEHLLNPKDHPYPISTLGTKSLGLTTDVARKALLMAARKAVRYNGSKKTERLGRADRIPWSIGFAELRRIVTTCGRYPKTTDAFFLGPDVKVNFYHFYRRCAEQYMAWRAGKSTEIEPHQLRELETLPHFDLYGVHGPYPWNVCMQYLEQYLEEHNGEPPMLNINNGGFVGLSASAWERLSGAMTVVNQGDAKDRKNSKKVGAGFVVPTEKQHDLDRICARFNLQWRKQRDKNGALVEGAPKTWIQSSYDRFKAYWKDYQDGKNDGSIIKTYYSGFPLKHKRQEDLEVSIALLPPRWKGGKWRNQAKKDQQAHPADQAGAR